MRISISVFAATVMLTAPCIGARADTWAEGPPTNVTGRSLVHYSDLNLHDEQGAKIMLLRIERAAKTACGGHATASSYTGSVDHYTFAECRGKAVKRAVKLLDAPLVTRIYSDRDDSRIAASDNRQP
jgi:UrcA family protein